MSKKKTTKPQPETADQRIERENIIKKVEKTLSEKDQQDKSFQELVQLQNLRNTARERVLLFARPIIEAAKMASPVDPAYLHSESGKLRLYWTLTKLYLDEIRRLPREDALMLLAFAWGEFTLNEFA